MRDFRKIQVWEKAHGVTLSIHEVTNSFPATERYGLISQMRRAAVSIGSNIAEGAGRNGERDFAGSMQIAFGSSSELEYQLMLSRDPGFMQHGVYEDLDVRIKEIKRMLSAFIEKLTADS